MTNIRSAPAPNKRRVLSLTFIIKVGESESALGVVEHASDTSAFHLALCFEGVASLTLAHLCFEMLDVVVLIPTTHVIPRSHRHSSPALRCLGS